MKTLQAQRSLRLVLPKKSSKWTRILDSLKWSTQEISPQYPLILVLLLQPKIMEPLQEELKLLILTHMHRAKTSQLLGKAKVLMTSSDSEEVRVVKVTAKLQHNNRIRRVELKMICLMFSRQTQTKQPTKNQHNQPMMHSTIYSQWTLPRLSNQQHSKLSHSNRITAWTYWTNSIRSNSHLSLLSSLLPKEIHLRPSKTYRDRTRSVPWWINKTSSSLLSSSNRCRAGSNLWWVKAVSSPWQAKWIKWTWEWEWAWEEAWPWECKPTSLRGPKVWTHSIIWWLVPSSSNNSNFQVASARTSRSLTEQALPFAHTCI